MDFIMKIIEKSPTAKKIIVGTSIIMIASTLGGILYKVLKSKKLKLVIFKIEFDSNGNISNISFFHIETLP